jgi:hypothetical protein
MSAKNPELLTFFNDVKGEPLGIIAIISLLGLGPGLLRPAAHPGALQGHPAATRTCRPPAASR